MATDPLVEAGLLDLGVDDTSTQRDHIPPFMRWREHVDPPKRQTTYLSAFPSPSLESDIPSTKSSACFVHALPSELILSIFNLLTHDIISDGVRTYFSPAWTRVGLVCTRWRELALCTSFLWPRISFAHSALATTMLARAGDTPIEILYGDVLARRLDPAVSLVLAGVTRLARLDILIPRALLPSFRESLSGTKSDLERVNISIVDRPADSHDSILDATRAQRLRSLVLDGAPLSPSADLFVDFGSLHELSMERFVPPMRWSSTQMTYLLAHTRSLRLLVLKDVLRVEDEEDSRGSEPQSSPAHNFSLPELRQLSIHAPTSAIATLIAHADLPPTSTACTISLVCAARTPSDCALSRCVPRGLRGGAIARMDVHVHITAFRVAFYTDAVANAPALELALSPSRSLPYSYRTGVESLRDFCGFSDTGHSDPGTHVTSLDLSSLRTLELDCDNALYLVALIDVLQMFGRACPALDVLVLSRVAFQAFQDARPCDVGMFDGALGRYYSHVKRVVVRGMRVEEAEAVTGAVRACFPAAEEAVVQGQVMVIARQAECSIFPSQQEAE
ncbi:hypothetical protein K488DRAFT_67796 [Vararia minispora EC-137]|uniref:Uncharacterized protein n=1 Tax=Vararia minispora EC-137 TaxID=1314806 RepID=A0ACB8QXE9_9AGAM|nr:hypothetical protein K488DRAFT_67796 [Vararia minispora EC-137]